HRERDRESARERRSGGRRCATSSLLPCLTGGDGASSCGGGGGTRRRRLPPAATASSCGDDGQSSGGWVAGRQRQQQRRGRGTDGEANRGTPLRRQPLLGEVAVAVAKEATNGGSGLTEDVDGEMAQHLKRLGRKDPTTKVKALTSLNALFKQVSGEELVQIVPKWAFEYRKLLYDYSREVRRATHEAMANLVTTIGEGIKELIHGIIKSNETDDVANTMRLWILLLLSTFLAPRTNFICPPQMLHCLDDLNRVKDFAWADGFQKLILNKMNAAHEAAMNKICDVKTLALCVLLSLIPHSEVEWLLSGLESSTKVVEEGEQEEEER
ncbi:hypothetical protein Taro_008428, partial [Colocasia esculenta]|nr:hypothetical protein [Colocasia esculenta]